MENDLNILQINVRKQRDNMSILLREKDVSKIDVIAIQEPYIIEFGAKKGNWRTHNPFSALFDTYLPESDTHPMVCFLINKETMNKTKISITERAGLLLSLDTEIEINEEWRQISIHNLYNPNQLSHNKRIEAGIFQNIPIDSVLPHLETALNKRKERDNIVVGDFNLWHPKWFGRISMKNGPSLQARTLAKRMDEHDLKLCIPPGSVTRPSDRSNLTKGTTIDLVWASELVWNNVKDCRVAIEYDCESDHMPVSTIIACKKSPSQSKTRRLETQIDKEIFNQVLLEHMPQITTASSTEECQTIFLQIVEALQKATDASAPVGNVTSKSCPGLSDEAKQAIEDYKEKRRRWRAYKTPTARGDYEKARRRKSAAIRKSNREDHRYRVSQVRDQAGLWKLADWAKNRTKARTSYTPALNKGDETMAETTEEKIDILKKTFFPKPPEANMEDIDGATYPRVNRAWHPITVQEVLIAIANTCNDKAPGDDGVTNRILKLAEPTIAPALADLFNSSVSLKFAPDTMKTTVTCVVKKADKEDYHDPRAYRPIALLNTIGKLFESIMTERLHYEVETYHQLPLLHTGGRKRVSCEHTIQVLMEKIYTNLRLRRVVSLLLLDISGAYDNVIHERLIHNMKKRGVHPVIVDWIDSWLKDRKARIRMNEGLSDWFLVTAGIPQGSPLSPILYLFYNADLLEIAHDEEELADSLITGYVDDTAMLVSGESTEETCQKLAALHKKAERWASTHASVFSPKKYKLIHFVHKQDRRKINNRDRALKLELNDSTSFEIQPVKSARYLGVILDEHLTWIPHLEQLEEKIAESIKALQAIAGSTWGVSREHMLKLFNAVIIPQMTYGASIWFPQERAKGEKTRYKNFVARLTALQKRALCVCTGAYRNTAAEVLEKETNTLPIGHTFKKAIAGATVRITSSEIYKRTQEQRFRTRPGASYPTDKRVSPLAHHQQWMKDVIGTKCREGGFPHIERSLPMAKEPWFHPVCTNIQDSPVTAIRQHNEIKKTEGNDHLIIYTDGSGINGEVGAAAWCSTMDWMKAAYIGTENQSNVYAAELTGIMLATELAIRKGNSLKRVSIFTDNQSATQTMQNPRERSGQYIVKRAFQRLRILYAKGITINIHWIPAHKGVPGNEKVDRLAKEATGWRETPARRGPKAPEPFRIFTLHSNVKRRVREILNRSWRDNWGDGDSGQEYKRRFGRTHKYEDIRKLYEGLPRAEASLAIQLRTAHIGFNAQLRRWGLAPSNRCECGESPETIRHVICECPLYTTQRRKHLGSSFTHDSFKCLAQPKSLKKVIRLILETRRLQQYSDYLRKFTLETV